MDSALLLLLLGLVGASAQQGPGSRQGSSPRTGSGRRPHSGNPSNKRDAPGNYSDDLGYCPGQLMDQWDHDHDPCYRPCSHGEKPRVCKYTFVEELYAACGSACRNCTDGVHEDCNLPQCVCPDGVERTLITINRKYPGPTINVCAGDTIEVTLVMKVQGHGEGIHWHGLLQKKTPYMDGVVLVTQCPIMFGQTFVYRFEGDLPGTYWYHPHYGINKPNGGVGVLVIRQPRAAEPLKRLYQHDLREHVVFLSDYFHAPIEVTFPGLRKSIVGQPVNNVVVNGKGKWTDPKTGNTTNTPLEKFEVEKGKCYRFRVINGGAAPCPISMQVEGHSMTVIASDSSDVRPVPINTLIIFSGERYDVVICANNTSGTRFWMFFSTTGLCANNGAVGQVAVLYYKTSKGPNEALCNDEPPSTQQPSLPAGLPTGTVLNYPARNCSTPGSICVAALEALVPPQYSLNYETYPDQTIPIGMQFHRFSEEELFRTNTFPHHLTIGELHLSAVLNNISFVPPPSALLTQPDEALPYVCDQWSKKPRECRRPGSPYCECTHVIRVNLGAVVEIVLVDTTTMSAGANENTSISHPFHLHGHGFQIRAFGTRLDILDGQSRFAAVKRDHRLRRLQAHAHHPAVKDVAALPGGGFVVLSFLANNPGFWFFHCHFDLHMAVGMELAFQVGEPSDMVSPPPGFPTCKNFLFAHGGRQSSSSRPKPRQRSDDH